MKWHELEVQLLEILETHQWRSSLKSLWWITHHAHFFQFRQMCQLFVVSMLAFSWTNRRFIDSFLIYSNFVWQHAYMRERTANFQSSFICQYDSLKFKRTIDRMNEWMYERIRTDVLVIFIYGFIATIPYIFIFYISYIFI